MGHKSVKIVSLLSSKLPNRRPVGEPAELHGWDGKINSGRELGQDPGSLREKEPTAYSAEAPLGSTYVAQTSLGRFVSHDCGEVHNREVRLPLGDGHGCAAARMHCVFKVHFMFEIYVEPISDIA